MYIYFMKVAWLFLFFSVRVACFCQITARGAILETSDGSADSFSGTAYALVVGISKYKESSIPSLNYADVDALAFYEFLLGNGVKKENMYMLLNEQATNAAFWTMLNYISDKARKGDQVYIYFSGHGDVETKTIVKDAYLLPYDSPSSVYPMGAIGLVYLKSWLATFSSKGVQTIFIADACRSGNLIGGREGMEAAANILKDTWQDEIKMVSCQPGEMSLESSLWGGGRGLFSYELINGLSGKADKNADDKITLRELYLYLMQTVPEKAGAYPQTPWLSGNFEKVIAQKNERLYAFNQQVEKDKTALSAGNSGPGMEINNPLIAMRSPDQNANWDSTALTYYNHLLEQLDNHKVIAYDPPHAYDWYKKIIKTSDRNKELKERARLLLSNKIVLDIKELIEWLLSGATNQDKGFDLAVISFEATILRELLGDKKLKESGILPQVLFAESCRTVGMNAQSELYLPKELAMIKLDSALYFDPSAVYVYCLKGVIYNNEFGDKAAALNEYKKALRGNPNFSIAKELLMKEFILRKEYDSIITYVNLGNKSFKTDLFSFIAYKKLNIPDSAVKYETRVLGHCYAPLYPEIAYRRNIDAGDWMLEARELDKAIGFYNKAIPPLNRLTGDSLFRKFEADGIDSESKTIDLLDAYASLHYNLACCYALLGSEQKALENVEIALNAGYIDFEWMRKDPDLAILHANKKFKKLISDKEKAYIRLNKN